MTTTETLITPEGLLRLREELEHLMGPAREEIEARLRQAAADADERAEALRELAALEARIEVLRERIQTAQVVEPDRSVDALEVGERVRVRDLASGRTAEYELVGALEADPVAGRISVVSPLGRALLGKRVGDVAVVEAPRGARRYRIESIDPPAGEAGPGGGAAP